MVTRLIKWIMDMGTALIITQQPVAKESRRITPAFKISSNLERIVIWQKKLQSDIKNGTSSVNQSSGLTISNV